MKIFLKETLKLSLLVSVATLAVFAATYAQTWNPAPNVTPPASNAPEPINVSDSTQSKLGNFTGNVIGANGFCLGTDCITAWPGSGGIPAGNIKIVTSAKYPRGDTPRKLSCGVGYKVTSGGFLWISSPDSVGSTDRPWSSYPDSDSSWTVVYHNAEFKMYAICVKVI